MKDSFPMTDDFGPARVILIRVPGLDLTAATVIDNTACGSAIGGVRMAPDVSIEGMFPAGARHDMEERGCRPCPWRREVRHRYRSKGFPRAQSNYLGKDWS